MRDEGYIKYTSLLSKGPSPNASCIKEINEARTALFDVDLIGVYPDGIGFGNLSVRDEGSQFVITGSATGDKRELTNREYALVTHFDIEGNSVESIGAINASSESMTHGTIYQNSATTKAIIHVHSRELFDFMLTGSYGATPADVPYGTPAMALAIKDLVLSTDEEVAIFVTAGHDEGVIAYGPDVESVKDIIFETYSKVKKND